MASPVNKSALGVFGAMAGRMAIKAALTMLLNTKSIVDYLAAEAYHDETGLDFARLSVTDKVLWCNRVQSVIRAAGNTV